MPGGALRGHRLVPGLMSLLATLLVMALATPTSSQVLEVDGEGGLTTYDRPMIFTGGRAAPIEAARVKTSVAATPSWQLWPQIEAQALRHGLPPSLLQAVAWRESRGRPAAVSRKGALGVMQLMPATAAAMGVDPRDPDDNLRGGAIYLRRQLDRFGSVPLALAAYNAGPAAVTRFGGIPPYRETRAYVASIMAHWQPEAAVPLSLIQMGNPPS